MKTITVTLPDELAARFDAECAALKISPEARILETLEKDVAPAANLKPGWLPEKLKSLEAFLKKIPGITWTATSPEDEPRWWIKFTIDLSSKFAWNVVQELGFVLNYISVMERLPTVFMPVSPPPYANGGPEEFLSWVIESKLGFLDPEYIRKTLEGRLPRPVDDLSQWNSF